MLKTFKYRIYPTADQIQKINSSINGCRLVFNLGLSIKANAWKEQQKSVSVFELCKQLKDIRADYQWLADIDSNALQASVLAIESGFRHLFNGGGYPKYKKKKTQGSFRCAKNLRKLDQEKFIVINSEDCQHSNCFK